MREPKSRAEIEGARFREFELAGWQRVAGLYDGAFSALTSQALEPLLDAAGVGAGTRLLEVAAGPGHGAAAAASRGAHVTAVDFSPAMVRAAASRYPGLDFQEADAEALPFEAAAFDALIMNFGLLHLGRPEAALREARRVLRRGGKVAFTVWALPQESVGFGILLDALEAHGRRDVPVPTGPPFFRFSDPAESVRALEAAGFVSASTAVVSQRWRLEAPEALFETLRRASVRTAALIGAQTPEALEAIRVATNAGARRYAARAGSIELPMPALLASAVRP